MVAPHHSPLTPLFPGIHGVIGPLNVKPGRIAIRTVFAWLLTAVIRASRDWPGVGRPAEARARPTAWPPSPTAPAHDGGTNCGPPPTSPPAAGFTLRRHARSSLTMPSVRRWGAPAGAPHNLRYSLIRAGWIRPSRCRRSHPTTWQCFRRAAARPCRPG